jgi:diguanylate cyclase (GGDEF)-like protein
MTDLLKKFISFELSLTDLKNPSTVPVFTVKMVFLAIIMAKVISAAVLAVGAYFGLLPMPFGQALAFSVVMCWIVVGLVTYVIASVVGRAIQRLSQSHAKFKHLSRTDTLSGLMNRRAFNKSFELEEDNASLAIFDLDRFKAINDSHGHSAGDAVISRVATTISDVFGDTHSVARLGGEEFAVIIRGGIAKDRLALVELARMRVAALSMSFDDCDVKTTVSVGVAEIQPHRLKETIFTSADQALYLAKSIGRNRVVHERDVPQNGEGATAAQAEKTKKTSQNNERRAYRAAS